MIPIKLSLSGFTSYRDPVEIDFTELDLVCISGANGAGKSSLLDAITYALYGQARKRDEAIINNACDKAEVTLIFAYEKQVYQVTRAITRGKGSEVNFFIETTAAETGEKTWKLLSERTLSETNKLIERTLRLDYETFINASFFVQGKADSFAVQKPADRKRILSSILGLEQWEQYREYAAGLTRDKKNEVAGIEKRLEEIQTELDKEDSLKANLAIHEGNLKAALAELSAAEAQLKQARAVRQKLEEQARVVAVFEREFHKAQAERQSSAENLEDKLSQLAQVQEELLHADAIEQAYTALQKLKKDLSSMDNLAEKAQPFEEQARTVQHELDLHGTKLRQELRTLQEKEADYAREQQQVLAFRAQLLELQPRIAQLQAKTASRAEVEAEQQELLDAQARKRAENEGLNARMKEIKERLTQVENVEGAACPLCGQPLSIHDRERLEAEITEEGTLLGDQYRANDAAIKATAQRLEQAKLALGQISRDEKELQKLTNESQQLTFKIDQNRLPAEQWQTQGEPRLKSIQAQLDDGLFLPDLRLRLSEARAELARLAYDSEEHARLRQEVRDAEPAQEAHARLGIAKNTSAQIGLAVEELESALVKQDESLDQREEEFQQAQARLEEDREGLPEILISEETIASLKEDEAVLQRQVGAARRDLHTLDELRGRKKTLRADKENLNGEIANLKVLERAFGKDGVPAMLIEQALPELEDEANKTLSLLSNYAMSVRFSSQRGYKDANRSDKKETLDIIISDGAAERDYETYSGGEAFRVNFAIRLALSKMLAKRAGASLKTLIIDEGFGNQDAEGRQRLIEAITLVKDDFEKILVITHIDELKEFFPARIEVEKGARGSQVQILTA